MTLEEWKILFEHLEATGQKELADKIREDDKKGELCRYMMGSVKEWWRPLHKHAKRGIACGLVGASILFVLLSMAYGAWHTFISFMYIGGIGLIVIAFLSCVAWMVEGD